MFGLLAAAVLASPAAGQDAGSNPSPSAAAVTEARVPPEVEASIERGIAYLLTQQDAAGSISDTSNAAAMTSLAIMAMASTGIMPTDPTPQGDAMRRAVEYMLDDKRHNAEGYFGEADGSRMYGHGIVSLMLTEMAGMGADPRQDRELRGKCRRAIDLILAAQRMPKPREFQGGWRYTPNASDSDLSVSVWQLLALRSAANDEMEVPPQAIAAAVTYLRRSFTGKLDERGVPTGGGGFGYMPGGQNPSFAMTAAGALAMQVCGDYDSPLVAAAEQWLRDNPPKVDDRFFYYGIYYYSQAMHQRGGQAAQEARELAASLILPAQKTDGSWLAGNSEEQRAGRVYATSLSVLSLSVRYHYLPIYQR